MPVFRVMPIGDRSLLVVDQSLDGSFVAACAGFQGNGSSEEAALDALISRMRDYNAAATDLLAATEPGGRLDGKLRELKAAVDRVVDLSARRAS